MIKYYLKYEIADELKFNAGGKAVEDCNVILENQGYLPFTINVKLVKNKLIKSLRIFKLFKLNSKDIIVIPHPLGLMHHYIDIICLIHRIKKFKICYLIHDLSSIRYPSDVSCQYVDGKMIKDADAVIVHNKIMQQYVMNKRPDLKIACLNIFDYLGAVNTKTKQKACTLNVTGNLSEEKAQYLYHAEKINENISINFMARTTMIKKLNLQIFVILENFHLKIFQKSFLKGLD